MSVEVSNLVKIYGKQKVVNELTFVVNPGEILGFLGPNGAGKSTTMKMITCFVPPSSGSIKVCGYDVLKDPIEVRKHIGYLPEHNPLYKEMFVREYLQFVASIYKINKPRRRIEELIEMTGLGKEQHKLIGALSKGYRQRVGLAQALMHDPEVLILDEPVSGLDPNQLIEIRNLIKLLGEEKTVIFSSHIMQEVQALCDRIVIINDGKLIVDGTIDTLKNKFSGSVEVLVEFSDKIVLDDLKKLSDISNIEMIQPNRFKVYTNNQSDIRPKLFEFAVKNNVSLIELHQSVASMENVFRKLTSK